MLAKSLVEGNGERPVMLRTSFLYCYLTSSSKWMSMHSTVRTYDARAIFDGDAASHWSPRGGSAAGQGGCMQLILNGLVNCVPRARTRAACYGMACWVID